MSGFPGRSSLESHSRHCLSTCCPLGSQHQFRGERRKGTSRDYSAKYTSCVAGGRGGQCGQVSDSQLRSLGVKRQAGSGGFGGKEQESFYSDGIDLHC